MSTATASVVRAAKQGGATSVFAEEYSRLNPKQRLAVETIEGPVMVVAGPGTGKTQVVAMRVANILKRTQMRPSNILCLTFSVSGATAMRERLRQLIGPDAYGVRVSTIHAFAQAIIEDHPGIFEEWSARALISDVERVSELNKIIDQFSSQHSLLNPKDPYSKTGEILGRISEAKREGKTIADLEHVADTYDREMAHKAKERTKAYEKNVLAARKFRDFVEIFRRYQEMLAGTGRYDYDDALLHVIAALEEHDWLLQGLQERYQYILVDEFQDTNGAQARLIELLTTYAAVDQDPNLFCVGDDDQAIYRFQGANLRNMLTFHERFPAAPVIPLTLSYRSTGAILSAAQRLIERNEERLVGRIPGLQKVLTAASGEAGDPPRLLRAPSDGTEPWLVADLALDSLERGIPAEEIAILTWKNDELFGFHEVLRARGIPVLLHGKDDLLSHPLVRQTLVILEALTHPQSDRHFLAALACECFRLHPADLARLAHAARERKTRLLDLLLRLPPREEVPLQKADLLERARDLLLDLSQKVASRTALETVEHVLRDCGLIPAVSCELSELKAHSSADPRDLAALEAFFAYVRRYCLERRSCTLEALLSELQVYSDPTYGQVRLAYELPHLLTKGVHLMTAHQSKGLEFHTVILTNFRDGHWDKRIRRPLVAVPEDLLYGWEKEQKRFEQHQDERRVAFVAMTRAKRALLMTCPREVTVGEKARAVSPSGFFAEMGGLPEEDRSLRDPAGVSLLLHPRPRALDRALQSYIEERLKTFMLSATSLNRFLSDPQEFLLVDLLGQPQRFDEGTVRRFGYGNAVHWALKQWAVARREGTPYPLEQFLEAFRWYLHERTILTEKQREDLLALGIDALPRYFEERLRDASPVLWAVEREYRAHLTEIPIKGKIDRIDVLSRDSSRATVIDYKAGKGRTESQIRGGVDAGKVSRTEEGGHFRQLAFYAVLLEQADPLLSPRAFVLEYIGERGEHPTSRSFTVSDAERDDLKNLIHDVWAKISALDFSPLHS